MVQIIQSQRAPSLGEALGAGLGQGMSQGLNMAVQTMYESKQNRNRNSRLLKALGKDDMIETVGDLPTEYVMAALKLKEEQGVAGQLSDLQKALSGTASPTATQNQQQPERTLPPGQAPMPQARQNGSGEAQYPQQYAQQYAQQQPQPQQQSPYQQQQQPQQQYPQAEDLAIDQSPRLTARQKLDNLENQWKLIQPRLSGAALERAQKIYHQNKNALVQEGTLEQRERSADIQERTFTSAQEEKAYNRNKAVYEKNEKQISETMMPIIDREEMNLKIKPQLAMARQAVMSGNTEGYYQFLAGAGFIPGITPDSALLNYTSKEGMGAFVEKMGGRNNQFLDRTYKTIAPSSGMPKESALALVGLLEGEMRHEEKHAEVSRKLEEKHSKSGKVLAPGQFKSEVNKEMKPWIQKNVAYTAYKIQEDREAFLSDEALFNKAFEKAIAPGSTPITQRRLQAIIKRHNGNEVEAVKKAKKLGYIFEPQMTPPE